MKALSIRQPWAWLILNAGKDIENREWSTRVRGRILIHAGKGMTRDEYDNAYLDYVDVCGLGLPPFESLDRGGVVGSVDIIDCVQAHPSAWFCGTWGLVLRDPRPLSFTPYRGELGFFNVPDHLIKL